MAFKRTGSKNHSRHFSFAKANKVVLVLIVVIDLYIILAPVMPSVIFWWQSNHTDRKQELTASIKPKAPSPTPAQAPVQPQPNHVVVPSMLLDTPILETTVAKQYSALDQGIIRWPKSSTPDKGGNTVILGHRFTYTNPRGILYSIDKVHVGDEIGVYWDNKLYNYQVASVTEVPPTDTSIEDNTTDARLTMFSCTPTWNPKDRLVVVAELENS